MKGKVRFVRKEGIKEERKKQKSLEAWPYFLSFPGKIFIC